MQYLYYYLLIVNAAGFLLMLTDKQKAIKNKWRIPEATLLGLGLIGGSFGCTLGMRLFRHKTKKLAFSLGLPLMLCGHILIILFLTV